MNFKSIVLPTGDRAIVPQDLKLVFPDSSSLTPHQRRATAYIPWSDKYLAQVPAPYRDFFAHTLPHLGSRTTDVHTALSVSQVPYLLAHSDQPVDSRVVYLATILHDTGWSKVSLAHIADSLSYSGLTLSEESQLPKQQHILMSVALAIDLLDSFDFSDEPIAIEDKHHITRIIRRHDYDAPWDKDKFASLSAENKLVCDADRLWSYTYENFWQDTVRKAVKPEEYLVKITGAIETYFISPQGKARAHQLVGQRRNEVQQYLTHIKSSPITTNHIPTTQPS